MTHGFLDDIFNKKILINVLVKNVIQISCVNFDIYSRQNGSFIFQKRKFSKRNGSFIYHPKRTKQFKFPSTNSYIVEIYLILKWKMMTMSTLRLKVINAKSDMFLILKMSVITLCHSFIYTRIVKHELCELSFINLVWYTCKSYQPPTWCISLLSYVFLFILIFS